MTIKGFKIPDYSGCGVYAIINIIDYKAYVGSSRNIRRRASQHLHDLEGGKHCIENLQKDSEKELRFVILDKYDGIEDDRLLIAEYAFMVKMIDRRFDLYNISPFQNVKDKRNQLCRLIATKVIGEYYGMAEKAIKEEFGAYPWDVRSRTESNRRKLLSNDA